MSQPPSSDPSQEMKIADSSVEGQIGQAGRDITQNRGSGNIYKDVTIFNFLERRDAQQRDSDKGLTRQEYKNRQALLNKVRNYWIKGPLEKSLYNRLKIELELEERLDAIEFVRETPERLCQILEPGTKAISKFDELGEGRTLLILGEPGSGKTITLLEIAQELIERAEKDPELPIPVVFNLSSWNREKWTMKDWLAQEFETGIYKIPKNVSKSWIQNQQLLLLLDGLDEVKQDCRESCIQAINRFSQVYGQTEIIVCSRLQAYEALSHRLRFQTTLLLQPLTLEQIQNFLDQVGERSLGIKASLNTDPVLQELAQTPLMLSIMMLAYEGISTTDFSRMGLEESQHYLWRRYIDRMLERKQKAQPYPKAQILLWLQFLAHNMVAQSQTTFLIEKLNPKWLNSKYQRWIYPIATAILSGTLMACTYGIFFGFMDRRLSIHMIVSLMGGILWGGLFSLSSDVSLFTQIGWTWSFDKLWKATAQGLLGGLAIGCLLWGIGRLLNLFSLSFLSALFLILVSSLVIACVGIISTGLVSSNITEPRDETQNKLSIVPNQGVRQSVNRAFWITLATLFVVILPFSRFSNLTFFPYSILLGCITLYSGGIGALQHFVIRSVLWLTGNGPQNYADVLNYATENMLLYKTGGGYQFIHNLLRHEIATLSIQKYQSLTSAFNFKKAVFSTFLISLMLVSFLMPFCLDTWGYGSSRDIEATSTPRNLVRVGDHFLVDRLTVHFLDLNRGDIIGFKTSKEMVEAGYKNKGYTGQILTIFGDNASIQGDNICINKTYLKVEHLNKDIIDLYGSNVISQTQNRYLVAFRDPRNNSNIIACHVTKKNITDRVVLRYWPVDRIQIFP
jgi:hypothetical protein